MSEPIDAMTAAALGALQGLTEFLPVSSSGHLAIAARELGLREASLELSVLLHLGTLIATLWIFRTDVAAILRQCALALSAPKTALQEPQGQEVGQLLVATLLTAAVALTLKPVVEAWSQMPQRIGWMLWCTALILLATMRLSGTQERLTWLGASIVGIVQGLAVMPGLSRSGLTIVAAMALGLQSREAFRFSFLLSLPAIAGAGILEVADAETLQSLGGAAWFGGAVALVTGTLALVMLRRVVLQGKLWTFALYLVPLGAFLILRTS